MLPRLAVPDVIVIGGGLAGSEAAWQAALRGMRVRLFEMRPRKMTPAHRTPWLAELVCSNSLRGASLENAAGLLKEELRRAGSLIMRVADDCKVPAGGALAVDRERFAIGVTEAVEGHPLIELIREEVTEVPDADSQPVIVASGPLTSQPLAESIMSLTGRGYLSFYDAAAPVITAESIDKAQVFFGSRYGKGGEAAYLNCPLDERQYRDFHAALISAQSAPRHNFDPVPYFEGCLPVEEMARRGLDTLRYGPLKPVGLIDPRNGQEPYAVVQLRQDNREGTLYNMVGFQTALKWSEQKRVFGLIPGLKNAEFVRFGVMHRNIFLNSPSLLEPTLQTRSKPKLLFAGQITGVEGYIESIATGLVAGINAARIGQGENPFQFPRGTAIGSLCHYIVTAEPEGFQPMNISFGLLPPLTEKVKGGSRARKLLRAERALETLARFWQREVTEWERTCKQVF